MQEKLQFIFNDDTIIFDKSRFAGGLTNYNYIMTIKGEEYVIRKPGKMTNQMIDRKLEKVNNNIASELGLNSECVYFDELIGVKISVYIKNSQNVALADPSSPTNLRTVSKLMKRIHSSPKPFPNSFDWQKELNKYEQIVKELNGDFFYDYAILKEKLLDFMGENIEHTFSYPCHNDTVPENFIINSNGRAYLIDWEYSGMNDPSWDVAAYILESKLTEESIQYFIFDYYGQLPTPEEVLKIKCFMIAQDLLWTVWALIRHYNGDDFLDYCYFRYERFRKNIKAITDSSDYSIADLVKN
ncbi:MAG TPA: choline/ethanolamine kinase family protein [Bacillota bacterium]|nr:choline/ethanolamine kinase family protein [Bacillota bacterium]